MKRYFFLLFILFFFNFNIISETKTIINNSNECGGALSLGPVGRDATGDFTPRNRTMGLCPLRWRGDVCRPCPASRRGAP